MHIINFRRYRQFSKVCVLMRERSVLSLDLSCLELKNKACCCSCILLIMEINMTDKEESVNYFSLK